MATSDITHESSSRMALARHFLSIDQPQRTLETLANGSGLDLEDWEFWYLRGQALYQLNRYDEALGTARNGLSKEPEAIPLLYLLCNLHAQQGDLAAAEAHLLNALRLNPEDPVLLCRYALLLGQGNQLDKASQLVSEAARNAPNHPMVARARATLAYFKGDDHALLDHSREILANDPEDVFGHYMLGATLNGMGDVRGAERQFTAAARLDPEDQIIIHTARQARYQLHPLLWPLIPAYRIGTIRLWVGAIIIVIVLNTLGFSQAASTFSFVYLAYCVYSWIVPPLLRWWLHRRAQ